MDDSMMICSTNGVINRLFDDPRAPHPPNPSTYTRTHARTDAPRPPPPTPRTHREVIEAALARGEAGIVLLHAGARGVLELTGRGIVVLLVRAVDEVREHLLGARLLPSLELGFLAVAGHEVRRGGGEEEEREPHHDALLVLWCGWAGCPE